MKHHTFLRLLSHLQRLGWMGVASLVIFAGVGCQKNGFQRLPRTYYAIHGDDLRTVDPALAYDVLSLNVVASVYDTLFQYEYLSDPYKLQPLLAADMPTYSKDRKTVTIPLRQDVVFQNGKPLVAEDFIYAFKRLGWPALASEGTWIFDDKIEGYREFRAKIAKAQGGFKKQLFDTPIPGFSAPDDHTLVIRLIRPYPQLLNVLALMFTAPMDRAFVEANANEDGQLVQAAMGTGPFALESWRRGHRIVLKRNPKYFVDSYPMTAHPKFQTMGLLADGGKLLPFLDSVIIDVVKEEQPGWLRFLKGEFDASSIPRESYDSVLDAKKNLQPEMLQRGLKLQQAPGNAYFFLSFNMKDSVVGKASPSAKYLRQAISSAISREELIHIFTNDRGIKMTHILPPGIVDRPSQSRIKYDFNLNRARELMKKAGYERGKGLAPLTLDMRGADSVSRQMGDYLAQKFASIGIILKVQFNTFPAYLEKTRRSQFQIAYDGWMLDYPDADNALQLVYGPSVAPGPNNSGFNDAQVNAWVEQVSRSLPSAARSQWIRSIDDRVQEESPWVYLYHRTQHILFQPWVHNVRVDELILNRYKYFRVEQARH